MNKKIVSILLSVAMLIGMFPAIALALDNSSPISVIAQGKQLEVSVIGTANFPELEEPFTLYHVTVPYGTYEIDVTHDGFFISGTNPDASVDGSTVSLENMVNDDELTETIEGMSADGYIYVTDSNKIAHSDVKSDFIYFSNEEFDGEPLDVLLVQVKTVPDSSSGLTDEQKQPLADLLATVTGEHEADWYNEDDRFNGNPADTITDINGSFWKRFTAEYGPRMQAQQILASASNEEAITTAVKKLTEEIDKLIPSRQINPTALYEKIQYCTTGETGCHETDATRPDNPHVSGAKLGRLLSDYTGITADAFRVARDEAENYLASLFDENGSPTADNLAEKDESAIYIAALQAAYDGMVLQESYVEFKNYYYNNLDKAKALLEKYNPAKYTESHYTPDTWAKYFAAYNELQGAVKFIDQGGIKADTDYLKQFEDGYNGLQKAWCNLESAVDVTVQVTYVSNASARSGSATVPTFRGDVKLTGGNATTQALWKQMQDNTVGSNDITPLLLYVNGVYYGMDGIGFSSAIGNTDVTVQLHNGDEVTLVRAPWPKHQGEASSGNDSVEISYPYILNGQDQDIYFPASRAEIAITAPETAVIGDKVDISGSITRFEDGEKLSPAGLTLFISEPNGNVIAKKTTAVSDADGKLQYVFAQPGEYIIGLFDLQADKLTRTDVFGEMTEGVYHSLYAGGFTTITVSAGENAEALLAQYREENLAKAKAYFEQFNDYDFAEGFYEATFKAKYDELTDNQNAATTFAELMDAFEADFAALQELAENVVHHDEVLAALRADMAYLPADLNGLNYTHQKVVGRISAAYTGLNDYQCSLLTPLEIEALDALLAYVEANPDYAAMRNITVTGFDGEYTGDVNKLWNAPAWAVTDSIGWDKDAPHHAKLYTVDADGTVTKTYYTISTKDATGQRYYCPIFNLDASQGITSLTRDKFAHPGGIVEVRRLCHFTDDYYRLVWSLDGGKTWQLPSFTDTNSEFPFFMMYTFRYNIPMDYSEDTLSVQLKMLSKEEYEAYVAAQDAAGLEEVRGAALAAIQAAYDGYDQSRYDAEGIAALQKALAAGQTAIDAATTNDAVAEARRAALAAMAAVSKASSQGSGTPSVDVEYDSGRTVGQVHVIIENQTFSSDCTELNGVYVDGWYDLGAKDTMMTVVLKALRSEGYSWGGTKGTVKPDGTVDYEDMDLSNYSITYISEINYGPYGLAEFDGGAKSGWMGTLNDWFTNEGFAAFSVAGGKLANNDEIHVMYTCDYGNDISGRWDSTNTSLDEMEVSPGTLTPAFDGDVTDYTLIISGPANVKVSPVPANKNYQYRIFLNKYNQDSARYKRTEAIPVKSGDVIYVGVGEQGWPTMNSGGKATKYIISVRTLADALAALPAASQVSSTNYTTYKQTAESLRSLIKSQGYTGDLSKLEALEEKVAFYSEIDNVKTLLSAIPAADKLTKTDKSKVEAAQKAYDDLSAEQQQYITISDVAKYNAAIEWLEKQGINTSAHSIKGSDKAPEEELPGVTTEMKPEVTANAKGEAIAKPEDKTVTETIEQAKKDNADVIVIEPDVKGDATKVGVELAKSVVEKMTKETDADLTVKTDLGDVTVPSQGLEQLTKEKGNNVTVTVEAKDGATNVEVAVGGKAVEKVAGGISVTVPADKANTGNVLAIVKADGTQEIIKKSVVEGKNVQAVVDGSCTVKVIENGKQFADTTNHWGKDAVAFVTARELFNGTSDKAFEPDAVMSRAMLATVLWRLEDEPTAAVTKTFSDIANGQYYTEAVAWASDKEIVTGYENGTFAPDKNINREELAAMLYRYAKAFGLDTKASGDLTKFADGDKVSGFASDAMKWAVGSGLMNGKENNTLDPQGNATRAEVATTMQRLVKLLVK